MHCSILPQYQTSQAQLDPIPGPLEIGTGAASVQTGCHTSAQTSDQLNPIAGTLDPELRRHSVADKCCVVEFLDVHRDQTAREGY